MVNSIVFTRREKSVLLAIKSGFAGLWGFINAVTVIQSGRFATTMTGNLIYLGLQTRAWELDEMALSGTLIASFVLGGALYDVVAGIIKNQTTTLRIMLSIVLAMGIAADVSQYALKECTYQDQDNERICDDQNLYFLAPVAFLTGIVASGYCSAHPDGVITIMMTGHMRVGPNALITSCLAGKQNPIQTEKACTSVALIVMYFVGSVVGNFAVDGVIARTYNGGRFTPLFTVFGGCLALACVLHSTLCQNFFALHSETKQLVEQMESKASRRNITDRDEVDNNGS